MELMTMGSIMSGIGFKDRVYDVIDQFPLPEKVREDAKRLAFDMNNEHTTTKTALLCIFVSSNYNKYDFKSNVKNIFKTYNEIKNHETTTSQGNLYMFVSNLKKLSNEYDFKLKRMDDMYNLMENSMSLCKVNGTNNTFSSPDSQSQ